VSEYVDSYRFIDSEELLSKLIEDDIIRNCGVGIHAVLSDIKVIDSSSSRCTFTMDIVLSNGHDQYRIKITYSLGRIGISNQPYLERVEYLNCRSDSTKNWFAGPWI